MTWHSLTHGTNGLLLAYGMTLLALALTLIRRRVGAGPVLLSPVLALPWAFGGILAASVVDACLATATAWRPVANVAVLLSAGLVGGVWVTRRRGTAEAHKRGTVLQWAGRAAPAGVGAVTLAGVVIPEVDETKHFKLLGTTGSGKSTAIRELLAGALARGDRAVIADPDGAYLARFHDANRGDVILNPFEERSARWDLLGEIERPYDVEQVARSLISEGADASSREWRAYARTFLAAILEYCKLEDRHDLTEVWRLISVAEVEELRDILAGTAAQPFLADGATKMFHSIRSTASPALAALKYAKKGGEPPLSVRRWVREGRGVLFLPYQAGQIAALRDLIATWLRLAIFETMTGADGDRRLWFIIDELDALGQVDGLKDALARLRKFGGRCALGFQSMA
jgi:type IV secretory pathway TraG/TraD family ATPase VirD4